MRRDFLNPGLFLYYKRPWTIVEDKAQYVVDKTDADILMLSAES